MLGLSPDLTPYTATQPEQPLLELNQRIGSINGPAASQRRAAARASARMSFAGPDEAPAEQLNRILWHDAKGWTTPYPTVKRSLFFPLSIDIADDEREMKSPSRKKR